MDEQFRESCGYERLDIENTSSFGIDLLLRITTRISHTSDGMPMRWFNFIDKETNRRRFFNVSDSISTSSTSSTSNFLYSPTTFTPPLPITTPIGTSDSPTTKTTINQHKPRRKNYEKMISVISNSSIKEEKFPSPICDTRKQPRVLHDLKNTLRDSNGLQNFMNILLKLMNNYLRRDIQLHARS